MMTSKERKKLKHSLKTELDRTDAYFTLINIGIYGGANLPEYKDQCVKGREVVVQELQAAKERLRQGLKNYEKAIDETIASMS